MRRRLPPGQDRSRTNQTLNWLVRPYPYLQACQRAFGDVFTLRLHALGDVVLLADPNDVATAFRLDPMHGRTGEANALMTPVVGDQSLFVLDGEQHRRRRAELRSAMAAKPPIDPDVVARLTLEELPAHGGVVEANQLFRWLAMRLIGYRVLGVDDPATLRPLAAKMRWLTGPLSSVAAFFPVLQRDWGPATPGFWFKRQVHSADSVLRDTANRVTGPLPDPPVVEQLSHLRRQELPGDLDQRLRDDLTTLVTAGDDTVASALSWALFWIARTPRVLERLQDRDDGVAAGAGPDAILRSGYLDAACLEALRITPVVDIVSRKTTVPLSIGGFDIPVGALLSPAVHLVHQRESLFEDPGTFRPERFLGRSYRPYEFFPFGGGGRRCLGAALAMFELKLVIGTLLAHYVVTPATAEDSELRYARRNVTVAPADPLRIRLTPRRGGGLDRTNSRGSRTVHA